MNSNDGAGPTFTLAGSDLRIASSRLLDTLPDAILVVGPDLNVTYLNLTARKVFGGGDESHAQAGISGLDLIHPEDRPHVLERLAQLLGQPGGQMNADFRVAHPDEPDGWKPVEANCTNLLDDPAIGGLVVSFRDRKLEHVMATSAQRLGRALERTSDLLMLHDREGTLLFANAAARTFLGKVLASAPNGGWPYSERTTTYISSVILPAAKTNGSWEGEVTAADAASYAIETYTYNYHGAYGGPEIESARPAIRGARVSADGLRVQLTVELRPGCVHELHATGVRSAAGAPLLHDVAYYTVNRVPR